MPHEPALITTIAAAVLGAGMAHFRGWSPGAMLRRTTRRATASAFLRRQVVIDQSQESPANPSEISVSLEVSARSPAAAISEPP